MSQTTPWHIGRYLVLGAVGPWRRGWLYVGRDSLAGPGEPNVWLKTLAPAEARNRSVLRRFGLEGKIGASLDHPNIIATRELGKHEGGPFIVFEALEGRSLRDAMNAGLRLSAGLPVVLRVLDGLAFMHARNVIHRDVTPANIFVSADGAAKITGLFLAKILVRGQRATATGSRMGTASYMSVEQALGRRLDARSDLFSLGCVLYELVAGHKAFHGSSVAEVVSEVVDKEPEMGLIRNGPEWQRLRAVITRSLQKRPEDRYPDAAAMREDLAEALYELGGNADWTPARV
jgi:eukaryotic-like serine/threonine-protein kinase